MYKISTHMFTIIAAYEKVWESIDRLKKRCHIWAQSFFKETASTWTRKTSGEIGSLGPKR